MKKIGVLLSILFLIILSAVSMAAVDTTPISAASGILYKATVAYSALTGFNVSNCSVFYPTGTLIMTYINPVITASPITFSYNFTILTGQNDQLLNCTNVNSTNLQYETFRKTIIGVAELSWVLIVFPVIFTVGFIIFLISALFIISTDKTKPISQKMTEILMVLFLVFIIVLFYIQIFFP